VDPDVAVEKDTVVSIFNLVPGVRSPDEIPVGV
jgi:hypothetical protein